MSSSSSEENDTTIERRTTAQLYSQSRPGPSQQSNERPPSENDEDDEHYMRFREEDVIDVDDAITVILSSLQFEQDRVIIPTDRDDDALRRLHEKIFAIITREQDDSRKRRLKRALPASNCVREQVFYLRRLPSCPSPSYFHRLSAALDTIVKDSFEEEYRKVATVLGLVEALAEVLILEVNAFGMPQTHNNEHRSIRKLIANALTNLTYGQIHSKRRLCSYGGFVRCVVRIVIESPNVTQVYAGLIRNLSWMADAEMSESLRPTVHALAIAAVIANKNRDEGCVKATLSALWNLASHSVENKRTICETPNCLAVLAGLLSTDVRQTAIVDSATGILKYVSQYLANTSSHLELRNILLTRLVSLLGSSSFTIVTNTLGAIANLILKDPHLQNALRHDINAVQQLNVLRNSNREDIRSAVKNVLNAVNQPTGHTRFGEMSSSMGAAVASSTHSHSGSSYMTAEPMMHSHHAYSSSTASPRLLPLRAARASPGRFMQPTSMDQRSCSLPRHFVQAGFAAHPHGMVQSYNQVVDSHHQSLNMNMNQQNPQQQRIIEDVNEGCNQDDIIDIQSETAMGTRSNSARSLGSADPGSVMNTGGWNSTMDTAANSSRALSPVSFSELPASPTMCAQVFGFNRPEGEEGQKQSNYSSEQPTPVFNQQNFTHATMPSFIPPVSYFAPTPNIESNEHSNTTRFSSGGSANTMTKGSDCGTTASLDTPFIVPTLTNLNKHQNVKTVEELDSPDDSLPGPSLNEDESDYAILGSSKTKTEDEDLLNRSIQAEKPVSNSQNFRKPKVSPRLNGFFSPPLTGSNPNSNTNSNTWTTQRNTSDSDRLLMECILSEMPQSKNGEADRRDAIIASHEPSDHGMKIIENFNVSGSNKSSLVRMESLESQASSEDSFGVTTESSLHTITPDVRKRENADVIDTSIPVDCFDDDEYDYTDDRCEDDDDFNATQFDDGINPHMTIDCSIISTGSSASLSKSEITTTSRDSRALATSTPKGSMSAIPMLKSSTRLSTKTSSGTRKTRLPVPRTNGTIAEKSRTSTLPQPNRPRLPPKPQIMLKSATSYAEDSQNLTCDRKDETIYVNAPIVEEQEHSEERIYMNSGIKSEKAEDSSSIGSVSSSTKSAIVQPYNYQKPFIIRSNGEMQNDKSVQPNPKQMLVTTV